MATITCREFLLYLEPWMEGERPPDAQAHLRACPNCSSIIKDLQMIQTEAGSWNAGNKTRRSACGPHSVRSSNRKA